MHGEITMKILNFKYMTSMEKYIIKKVMLKCRTITIKNMLKICYSLKIQHLGKYQKLCLVIMTSMYNLYKMQILVVYFYSTCTYPLITLTK